MIPPAVQAAICLVALGILRRLGFAIGVTGVQVVRALSVARSTAYEHEARLRAQLEDDSAHAQPPSRAPEAELQRLHIETAALCYRVEHPGCWIDGGRTVYTDELRAFILALAVRAGVGERMTQEQFAETCGIPLPTLKPWWAAQRGAHGTSDEPGAHASAPSALAPKPSAPDSVESAAASPQGVTEVAAGSSDVSPPPAPAASSCAEVPNAGTIVEQNAVCAPDEAASASVADGPPAAAPPTAGFTLEMLRIIKQWDSWRGSFDAFVREHLPKLGIRHGKKLVSDILHLAAARKLVRRPPPRPPARGSTVVPPPGVQWSSDGKQVVVVVGDEPFTVAWQPMVDIGSTATVGSVVRPAEDAAGLIASFTEAVQSTGAAPAALLLDNKPPNKSAALQAALPDGTFLMHGTPGRGQSKATVEGGFGLFAQDLGSIAAVVDTASPERVALSVADAVTRAYARGRNHRPRRKDGKTPYEIYRDADASAEQVAAAIAKLRAIKARIEARDAREAARRDPLVLATLEDACTRFGFVVDGDVLGSLATLPPEPVQAAVAIYAAKRAAGSLPADVGLRYFAGIARNCLHARELQLFEDELVSLLEREQQSVLAHLERKAASLASLDFAPRLGAIVHELLTVNAPLAQVFWRRCFTTVAAIVPQPLRTGLRRWLCDRIRRLFSAAKHHRQQLIELVVRTFALQPSSATGAS